MPRLERLGSRLADFAAGRDGMLRIGMAALYNRDIDILATPDPLTRRGVVFEPFYDYEQVLVMARHHRLAGRASITAADLAEETLLTYPVATSRLDIFTELQLPAGVAPRARPWNPPIFCYSASPLDAAWRLCRVGWRWNTAIA